MSSSPLTPVVSFALCQTLPRSSSSLLVSQMSSYMNSSTGIGGVSTYSAHDSHRYADDSDIGGSVGPTSDRQPNTANPFNQCIIHILQSTGTPSAALLSEHLGGLANQEDKLHAIACGMIAACFKIYDGCKASKDESSVEVRELLLRILNSFVRLAKGRSIVWDSIGMERTLALLQDSAPTVRVQACTMLSTLASFPDSRIPCAVNDGAMLKALVGVFLRDPAVDVVYSTLNALQEITIWAPRLDAPVLQKLAAVISEATTIAPTDRLAAARLRVALQVVWNSSLHSVQKDLAIKDAAMVECVVPLLENAHDAETMRLAAGLLASLAVAQSGKSALIAQPGAVSQACKLTLDRRAAALSLLGKSVRDNAIALVRNFCENAAGLAAVGSALILEPEALLAVLGADQTAKVIAPRLAAAAGRRSAYNAAAAAGYAPAASQAVLSSPVEVLSSLRALLALLKSGPGGELAAWNILDVVPALYALTKYVPATPPSAAQSDTVSSIANLAGRCLLHLCDLHDEARLLLEGIGRALPAEVYAREDIFALVEGAHIQATQKREAEEKRRREEEEARAVAAAEAAAEEARIRAEEEAARAKAEAEALQVIADAEAAAAAAAAAEGGDDAKTEQQLKEEADSNAAQPQNKSASIKQAAH